VCFDHGGAVIARCAPSIALLVPAIALPVGGMNRPFRQTLDSVSCAHDAGDLLSGSLTAPSCCFKGGPPMGKGAEPRRAARLAHPAHLGEDNAQTAALLPLNTRSSCPIRLRGHTDSEAPSPSRADER